MRSLPRDEPDTFIPEVLDITIEDFEEVYPLWVLWQATGKRFLPNQLLEQPQVLTDQLLYVDSIFQKMVAQHDKRSKKK
jgi:hypothetical protein